MQSGLARAIKNRLHAQSFSGENRHVRQKSTACSLLVQPYREIKNPAGRTQRGFYSGDVLLSHGLSPHYHRGCSVSLPCSEWERVVPLRYYHQRSEPDWRFAASQRRKRESGSLMTMSVLQFQKTAGSLISTYRKRKRTLRLRFV